MNDLPPPLPFWCIRSITEAETPGKFLVDMPSLRSDDGPLEVDEKTINSITSGKWEVAMCPPGWPNPPETDS
jgi:hypothetical protein